MQIIYLFVFFGLLTCQHSLSADNAEVYKSVDKNGRVTYSDSPSKNAKKTALPEILSIPPLYNPDINSQEASRQQQQIFAPSIKIISPKNQDMIIAAKQGNFSIRTSLTQPLTGGYHLALYDMDKNEQLMRGITTKFILNNQSRGQHNYEVRLINPADEVIAREQIQLFIQRHKIKKPPKKQPIAR